MSGTEGYLPPERLTVEARRSLNLAIARSRLLDQLVCDLAKARACAVANKGHRLGDRWHTVAQLVEADIRKVRAPGWRP